MNQNSATDVENRRSKDTMKGYLKKNLGLIIALGLALVASIIFMSFFIVYHQKFGSISEDIANMNENIRNENKKMIEIEINSAKMKTLGRELFDVSYPKIENGNIVPSLIAREMKYTNGFEKAKGTFRVMQFNMLSDARSGLYDDPLRDDLHFDEEAMKPENQHSLYFRYRLPLIISEIQKNRIDIVALQANEHEEEVKEALNLNDSVWECKHIDNDSNLKDITDMKYKPNNIQSDGNTICWNTKKFEQKDFVARTYKGYEQSNNPNNLEDKVLKGDKETFMYVILENINTGRKVIVFTTELYRGKSLGGEQIRLAQVKELMKEMKTVKQNYKNAALVFAADLNAVPKKEDKVVESKKETLLQASNIEGDWTYTYTLPNNEVVEKEKVTISLTNNTLTMEIRDKKYDIVENETNFKVMIDDRIAVLDKVGAIDQNKKTMSNEWLEKEGSVVLTNCRKEAQTEIFEFDMNELFKHNVAGKTFYDNYNVTYDFHEYEHEVDPKVDINKCKDAYETATVKLKDVVCDGSLNIYNAYNNQIYLTRTTNDIYKGGYPAAVYSYINSDEENMPYYKIDENNYYQYKETSTYGVSELYCDQSDVRKNYKSIINKSIKDMLNLSPEEKNLRNEVLQLKSSQKVVNKVIGDEYEEVDFTTIEQKNFNTEDYIFYADTGVVAPIAYLKFPPRNDLTSLPRYDYPSNHLSVVTEFTWINE